MTDSDRKTPILKNVEQVADGWLKKYILTYLLPDGTAYEYETVSRKELGQYKTELENLGSDAAKANGPDAICIVPILPDGSILLIREFRYAINNWIIALPAGLMEPGESIDTCIDRELYEETGYQLRRDVKAPVSTLPQSGFSSVGMTDENVLVAKALVEPASSQHLEKGEFIELFTLAPDEISDFLKTNSDPIGTRCQLILECLQNDGTGTLRN